MATVELNGVTKRYGDVAAVKGIDLRIADNEFIVLVGPSGCGKSTTLRMVAGLESISAGTIKINDRIVNDVPPKDRDIAMVFQNYALYPHMTVYDNMGFGLKMRKYAREAIDRQVRDSAAILGLTELLARKPAALSGGQRQRVAMGRAIVRRPEVFLFDEPLSNLDAQLRTQMRMELKKLHLKLQTTTLYVTHDQVEAMTLADRIVILKDGDIQQIGTPVEVYEKPANIFVAGFIGNPPMNTLESIVRRHSTGLVLAAGNFKIPVPDDRVGRLRAGLPVVTGIRPDAIKHAAAMPPDMAAWQFEARVVVAETMGGHSLLELNVAGHTLLAELEGHILPAPGERLPLALDLDRLHLFDPDTAAALA